MKTLTQSCKLLLLFVFLFLLIPPQQAQATKKEIKKYQQCRLSCLDKDEICLKKANKKNKPTKDTIKCLTKKNKCLEKCSENL